MAIKKLFVLGAIYDLAVHQQQMMSTSNHPTVIFPERGMRHFSRASPEFHIMVKRQRMPMKGRMSHRDFT